MILCIANLVPKFTSIPIDAEWYEICEDSFELACYANLAFKLPIQRDTDERRPTMIEATTHYIMCTIVKRKHKRPKSTTQRIKKTLNK